MVCVAWIERDFSPAMPRISLAHPRNGLNYFRIIKLEMPGIRDLLPRLLRTHGRVGILKHFPRLRRVPGSGARVRPLAQMVRGSFVLFSSPVSSMHSLWQSDQNHLSPHSPSTVGTPSVPIRATREDRAPPFTGPHLLEHLKTLESGAG